MAVLSSFFDSLVARECPEAMACFCCISTLRGKILVLFRVKLIPF